MRDRKELKKQVKQQVEKDISVLKDRKSEVKGMTKDEQKLARKADKKARKVAKKEHKAALKTMPKQEKRRTKKYDKYYKRYKTRLRRCIVWSIVCVLLLALIVKASPIVGDFNELMDINLNTGTPEAAAAIEYGEDIAEAITDEGIVLLKNDEDLLPLMNHKVNVFGVASVIFETGGEGSGTSDESRSVNLYKGLNNAGIEYNHELYDVYKLLTEEKEHKIGLAQLANIILGGETEVDEPDVEHLTDELISNARDFSDTAIFVISNAGAETADKTVEDLSLSFNQKAMLDIIDDNFENIVIIVNSGNTYELGFVDEYPSIKSVLWTGLPGPRGANSIGRTLTGDINPSGRLVDTYVYDLESHPSMANSGDFDYTNIKGRGFLNYEEGIYVGYRFFETYFEDNEAGYQATVQYPFGYGLSYTEFDWEIVNQQMDMDQIQIDVKVTNTGDVAGKEVVQVYFSAPYYEGGIEKSAIEMAGYAKTGLLEAGQSETLTISFATRDMSSYDMNVEQAYVLDKGTYEIHISKNVHDHVSSFSFEVADTVVYAEDETTGVSLKNQFDFVNGDLTYLSRNDWEGTYPDSSDTSLEASQDVLDALAIFAAPERTEGTVSTTGAENGILLADLKGLDYDDPMWDEFIDQFTFEEMSKLVSNGAYKTVSVDRLGLPNTVLLDGPAGLNFFFKDIGGAASYPTQIVISSTWNDELAYKWGEAVGKEANVLGVQGWYAPGMNIHRNPTGGRNFEYFSEDPLLSGNMSASVVRGAQSQKIMVFIKHFVLHELEVNANTGVFIWANEQAIREVYLRPFEISVKEGNATAAMTSFSFLGHKWSGSSEELLQNVLRDEWGFTGVISSDAALLVMDLNLAIRYGNDLTLTPLPNLSESYLKKLYKEDPVGVTKALRERVRNICYSVLEYTSIVD